MLAAELTALKDEDVDLALGIEAQRAAIIRFAKAEGIAIVGEYIEFESGKGADALDRRPQLAAALAAARSAKCWILVAKLDRLSHDVAFVSGLMAQRVTGWISLVDRPTETARARTQHRCSRLSPEGTSQPASKCYDAANSQVEW